MPWDDEQERWIIRDKYDLAEALDSMWTLEIPQGDTRLSDTDVDVLRCLHDIAKRVGLKDVLAGRTWVAQRSGHSESTVRASLARLDRFNYVTRWDPKAPKGDPHNFKLMRGTSNALRAWPTRSKPAVYRVRFDEEAFRNPAYVYAQPLPQPLKQPLPQPLTQPHTTVTADGDGDGGAALARVGLTRFAPLGGDE